MGVSVTQNPTKLMDGLSEREERKILVGKKLMPQLGNEPLPFACETSTLTTEPP